MKTLNIFAEREFRENGFHTTLIHDSENFKILNFNFKAGQVLPVHSHDIDGELLIAVIEGEGAFLGENGAEIPAKEGDTLVAQIREPHGVRADTQMSILVTIAPPI